MDNGIDEAASAFDAAIANDRHPQPAAPEPKAEKPTERLFGGLGELEVDEDSPPVGGGDVDEGIYADNLFDMDSIEKARQKALKGGPDDEEDEEGAEDDEGDEGDDDGVDGPIDFDSKVTVMVDGNEQEVSLREALDGYIRTETFHQRLNEVEETNQIVQRAAADVVQNFQHAKTLISEMEEWLGKLIPAEPDWDQEFATNPQAARVKQKWYQDVATFKTQLKEKRAQADKQLQEHDVAQTNAFIAKEAKRFAQLNAKNWGTDPKKKAKDLQSMRRTALQEGFSEQEIDTVYDSRLMMVLLKASKYDRMMAARPKPTKVAGSKSAKPGSGTPARGTNRRGKADAMKQLARTGSVHDAALVFDQIARGR